MLTKNKNLDGKSGCAAGSTRSVPRMCKCFLLLSRLMAVYSPVYDTYRHFINSVNTLTLLMVNLVTKVAAVARGISS